jgi:hypothetical protein
MTGRPTKGHVHHPGDPDRPQGPSSRRHCAGSVPTRGGDPDRDSCIAGNRGPWPPPWRAPSGQPEGLRPDEPRMCGVRWRPRPSLVLTLTALSAPGGDESGRGFRPPSRPLGRYLVDSASSHMLVSKIKPCMSKYKHIILRNCEWLIKSVIVYLIVPLPG